VNEVGWCNSHSRTTASDDFAFCITFSFCNFRDSLQAKAVWKLLRILQLESAASSSLSYSSLSHISMLRVGVILSHRCCSACCWCLHTQMSYLCSALFVHHPQLFPHFPPSDNFLRLNVVDIALCSWLPLFLTFPASFTMQSEFSLGPIFVVPCQMSPLT